jgi:hypothetical protein
LQIMKVGDSHGFEAPNAITSWRRVQRSRKLASLRESLLRWASKSGQGIRDGWLIASALATLNQYSPRLQYPSECWERWVYHADEEPSERYSPSFAPTFAYRGRPAHWIPNHPKRYGDTFAFNKAMQKQFNRQLSAYVKSATRGMYSPVCDDSSMDIARWTAARLSGMSWGQISSRYKLDEKYTEGETQAKKRVREFAADIGLTFESQCRGRNRGSITSTRLLESRAMGAALKEQGY